MGSGLRLWTLLTFWVKFVVTWVAVFPFAPCACDILTHRREIH